MGQGADMSDSAYDKLIERSREIALFTSSAGLLSWDQETFMPGGGVNYRAEQLAFLGGKAHALFTAPEVGEWIATEEGGASDGVQAANVRAWRWSYDRATKLPVEFVQERARVSSLAKSAWAEARETSEFSRFAPHLEKIVDLNRRQADYYGYEGEPYDALLETYERGATTAGVGGLFEDLKPQLREIGRAAAERSANVPADLLAGDYPQTAQADFNSAVAAAFGFDFQRGRIDTTTHPFCTGLAPGDTRLTTRYDTRDFSSSFYGVLHETGHGLYEQGLPEEHFGTPAGSSASLGIHESQSRLWENHVGRQPAFWNHWYGKAVESLPTLKSRSVEDLSAAAARSQAGFIRVDADEATYDLHIILRFEIERELISGELAVADLPEAWNARFENFFGLQVDKDSNGCLQDIHWSMGALGYFPTYTIGNLCAAQLFAKAGEEISGMDQQLATGNYSELLAWLRSRIHEKGSQLLPNELIEQATGQPLDARFHLEHLKARYL